MRDGLSEILSMLIGVTVLVLIPILLESMAMQVRIRGEAEKQMYAVVMEADRDNELSMPEAEYFYNVAAMNHYTQNLHLALYSTEGVNNGRYGDYIYILTEKQIYEILEEGNSIMIPEGGLIGVYR